MICYHKDERILNLTREELASGGAFPIIVTETADPIFEEFARTAVDMIIENNKNGKNTVMIMPLGPTGHYNYMVKYINDENVSLKNVTFINMDEYMSDENTILPNTDPVSFEYTMNKLFYSQVREELLMPKEQRIFPNLTNGQLIRDVIAKHGYVDLCLGGIGVDGHVAFNEPPQVEGVSNEEYQALSVRVLEITLETRLTNSISSNGGAMEFIPTHAITIGFAEIMQSKKIMLCCGRPWHRMTVRKASFYPKSCYFPVTLLQGMDVKLYIDQSIAD